MIDSYDIKDAWYHALNKLNLKYLAVLIQNTPKDKRVDTILRYTNGVVFLLGAIENIWDELVKEFILFNGIEKKDIISIEFDKINLVKGCKISKIIIGDVIFRKE